MYDMALFTYLIAFGHFTSELLIFRTAKVNPGVISPVIVASAFNMVFNVSSTSNAHDTASTLIWMTTQYDFYVTTSSLS